MGRRLWSIHSVTCALVDAMGYDQPAVPSASAYRAIRPATWSRVSQLRANERWLVVRRMQQRLSALEENGGVKRTASLKPPADDVDPQEAAASHAAQCKRQRMETDFLRKVGTASEHMTGPCPSCSLGTPFKQPRGVCPDTARDNHLHLGSVAIRRRRMKDPEQVSTLLCAFTDACGVA